LNEGENKWETPDSVTEKQYLEARSIVQKFMKDLVKLDRGFSPEELKAGYVKFKDPNKKRDS
jgi:hypothetical protein